MSSLNATGVLPNTLTPLAFVSPEEAYQTTTVNYAAAASLAILVWDILDNAVGDYYFLRSRLNLPLFAYFASRIGAMGYLLGSVIFSSVPTGNCALFEKIVASWCPVAFSSTALLFFLRLRAVYNRNRVVVATFFVLWLALLAASIAIPFNTRGAEVGPTKYCTVVFVAEGVFVVQLTPLLYDTLVFAAISWRLCRVACIKPSGPKESLKLLFLGKYLPAFTKSLYLDGQVYYSTALLGGVVVAFFIFAPEIQAPLRMLASAPYVVLVNIMACRVYRRTRMGLIRESEISTSTIGRAIPVEHTIIFENHAITSNTTIPHITSLYDATGAKIERSSLA